MSKNRYVVIPAVYLILERENQFLLMLRANTGYADGFYSLPSGHLDPGENLLQAMVREAREEIGIELAFSDLELAHVQSRPNCNDGGRIDFFFLAKKWQAQIQNCEPHKCAELLWADANAIAKLPVIAHVKQVFAEISKKMLYSGYDLG